MAATDGNGDGNRETFEDELEALGFVEQSSTRRGGTIWQLRFNRHLTFYLHDYRDSLVMTWSFALGEYLLERGFQVGAGETSFQELYPQADARLAVDMDAVRAEITRVLASLRFDLADPEL